MEEVSLVKPRESLICGPIEDIKRLRLELSSEIQISLDTPPSRPSL